MSLPKIGGVDGGNGKLLDKVLSKLYILSK